MTNDDGPNVSEPTPSKLIRGECRNCGAALRGQYCAECGQRAEDRLISLWQLLREAFGDLFEFDSRLWRTLTPLLLKPGHLTKEYLQGRRARYMPPFRTYLVLSILFFLFASFDPREDFSLLFEAAPEPTTEELMQIEAAAKEAEAIELAKREQAQRELQEMFDNGELPKDLLDADDDGGIDIDLTNATASCDIEADDIADLPEWLAKRITLQRARDLCTSIVEDDGKAFLGLLWDKIPIALIVLLPLMAFVLKVLYPLSRRYFVEHLLFFVHFHAFFFFVLTLQIIVLGIMDLLRVPEIAITLLAVSASLYIPVNLYLAMRRVYGQGHLITVPKYVVLIAAYIGGVSLTLLGALLFAVLSV